MKEFHFLLTDKLKRDFLGRCAKSFSNSLTGSVCFFLSFLSEILSVSKFLTNFWSIWWYIYKNENELQKEDSYNKLNYRHNDIEYHIKQTFFPPTRTGFVNDQTKQLKIAKDHREGISPNQLTRTWLYFRVDVVELLLKFSGKILSF